MSISDKAAIRSFDPIKFASDGYALRAEWSAEWVQVSISPCSGATHYMRLTHEQFARWVGRCAAALPLHEDPLPQIGDVAIEVAVADAIDNARYQHPDYPRERPRPFSEADRGDREYAMRLARAAVAVMDAAPFGWRYDSAAPFHDDAALKAALEQIRTVCIDNGAPTCRHDMALKFVCEVASNALLAAGRAP